MIPGLVLLFLSAATDWLAVAKNLKKLEYIAKPATMLVLLGLLARLGGFKSLPLVCFSLGLGFSLAGDVFLMISYNRFSGRWFIPGLVAFLLAHVSYIVGFNTPSPNVSPLWSIGLAVILSLSAARILKRIITGLRKKGLPRMERPVGVYGTVITLMLLSALLTIVSPVWETSAAVLVAVGAILFYFSDILLAWNKFINPITNGRLVNMVLYHLGQFALIAGVLLHYRH